MEDINTQTYVVPNKYTLKGIDEELQCEEDIVDRSVSHQFPNNNAWIEYKLQSLLKTSLSDSLEVIS